MRRKWAKGSKRAALLTASFVALGAGVAQADVTGGVSDLLNGATGNVSLPASPDDLTSAPDVPVVGDLAEGGAPQVPGVGALPSVPGPEDVNPQNLQRKLSDTVNPQEVQDKVRSLAPQGAPGVADLPTVADQLGDGASTNGFGENNNVEVGVDLGVGINCNKVDVLSNSSLDCPDRGKQDMGASRTLAFGTGGDGSEGGTLSNNNLKVNADAGVLVECNMVSALSNSAMYCPPSSSGGPSMVQSAAASNGSGGNCGLLSCNNAELNPSASVNASCNQAAILASAALKCGGGAVPPGDDGGVSVDVDCNDASVLSDSSLECGDDGGNGGDNGGDNGDNGDNGGDNGGNGGDDGGDPTGSAPDQAGDQLPFTGLNLGSLLALALGALAAGAACVVAAMRRPRANEG